MMQHSKFVVAPGQLGTISDYNEEAESPFQGRKQTSMPSMTDESTVERMNEDSIFSAAIKQT